MLNISGQYWSDEVFVGGLNITTVSFLSNINNLMRLVLFQDLNT